MKANKKTSPEVQEIWTLIKETQKNNERLQKNNERLQKNNERLQKNTEDFQKKFEEGMITLQKETEETKKSLKKAQGLFITQWGKLMESLVEGDLIKILNERNIQVHDTSKNISGQREEEQFEYDIIASNGTEMVIVEVKTTLKVQHVKKFLQDIQKFTQRYPIYKNKTIYGAVAYLQSQEEATTYAAKQGLLVIRATGSSSSIINRKNFKPKAFN